MHVHVELCLVPLESGSLSPYIARCQQILRDVGLQPQMHAYGTNVEGDWDTVLAAIRRCHEEVHAMGAGRIHSSLKIGTRIDRAQSLQDKIDHVRQLESH